jgi:hypothetical protein
MQELTCGIWYCSIVCRMCFGHGTVGRMCSRVCIVGIMGCRNCVCMWLML